MMEEVTTGYAEQEAAGGSVGRIFKEPSAGGRRPPGIAMCSELI
jgi:hypothetical protein